MSRTTINNTLIGSGANSFLGIGKNRIINGDIRIDQRHEGTSVSTPFPRYIVDGLVQFMSSGSWTGQQLSTTPPTGFTNYIRYTVTSAGTISAGTFNYAGFVIEAPNMRDFLYGTANAVTVTLSFWVRSSVSGTYSGSVQNTGSSRSYAYTFSIPSANTWTYITQTIPGDVSGSWPTAPGAAGYWVDFDLGCGSNFRGTAGSWQAADLIGVTGATQLVLTTGATFDITGAQLEIGSQATAFEYVPYEVQLNRCMRYFEKSWDVGVVPGTGSTPQGRLGCIDLANGTTQTQGIATVVMKVPKAVDPSITVYVGSGTATPGQIFVTNGIGSGGAGTANIGPIGMNAFQFYVSGLSGLTSSNAYSMTLHYIAEAGI